MPLLNAGVARRLLLATTATFAFAVFPQLAQAQAPGSLAQLASPNNCIQDTNVEGGSCPNSTANGLSGTTDVAVSLDGKNVYALGPGDEAIAEFIRNPNGSLSALGCIADTHAPEGTSCPSNETAAGLFNTQAIVVSPDGKNVYVAGQDDVGVGTIAEFVRSSDGSLMPVSGHDCIGENAVTSDEQSSCEDQSAFGIVQPIALAISPHGDTVYAVDRNGEDIAWFARAADGSLSQTGAQDQCIEDSTVESTECSSSASGLSNADAVVVSPDGSNVYTGSSGGPGTISWFARAADGSLSPIDCIQEEADTTAVCGTTTGRGIGSVTSLAVSPDGGNIYAVSNAATGDVAEFTRNGDGSLTQLGNGNNCIEEATEAGECDNIQGLGLDGALSVKVSADGENVYVATRSDDCCDDAVAEFSRAADGALTQSPSPDQCLDSGNDCETIATGLGGGQLVVSPDGTNVYVTGSGSDIAELARIPFQRTLTVSVAGTGSGAVSDGGGAISCPSTCSHAYNAGTQVTLTATPSSGSTFAGWGGACSGTGTCQVAMNADTGVTAAFSAIGPPPPGAPAPVLTGAPTAVTDSGAGFSGSVNPEGLPTTVFFQYGLDKRYSQVGASGANYTQRTPSQSIGSDFSTHNVGPVTVSGLVPNALYHLRLVATNSAGTTFGQDVTFTTHRAPNPGAPTLGQSFNIAPVSGLVLILIHGQLVPLTQIQQVPLGVVIDSLHGTFQLTTATGGGGSAHEAAAKGKRVKTQTGKFGGAVVRLHQTKRGPNRGLTTVMMVESAFKGAPSQAICEAPAGDAHAAARKTIQLLHASAHGKFRTSGRYSAATVRGTRWTMTARCDGTLTHVLTDSVVVTDFIRHKTIVLHAGQSYLAPSRHKP